MATDINRATLAKAARGAYGRWSFRGTPPEIQAGYFTRRPDGWEISSRLRAMVTFDYLNLVEDVYPSLLTNTTAMDLIMCRNVLIYFSEATSRAVVERLHQSLVEGGWLIVGHVEPSHALFAQFAVRSFADAVIYQKAPPAPRPSKFPAPTPRRPSPPPAAARSPFLPPSNPRPWPAPAPAPSVTARRTPADVRAPDSALQEAMALWQSGEVEAALARLEALAQAFPGDEQAPYLAAKIQASRLQLDSAEKWIALALERAPLSAPTHYLRGLIHQERGQAEQALMAYRRSTYADPGFALGHYALGVQCQRLGQSDRALKALDIVTRLLAGQPRDASVPEGDGLSVGRLIELAALQREFIRA